MQLTLPEGAELTDGDRANLANRLRSNIGQFLGLQDGLECDVTVGTYLKFWLINFEDATTHLASSVKHLEQNDDVVYIHVAV